MINALNSSVSGLIAQSAKIQVGALNIASADISGSLDPNNLRQPYQALDVNFTSIQNGGVRAIILPRDPGAVISYSPDSPFANEEGFIGVPNVNLGEELINNLQAAQAYKANLQIIPVIQNIHDALLDAVDKNA